METKELYKSWIIIPTKLPFTVCLLQCLHTDLSLALSTHTYTHTRTHTRTHTHTHSHTHTHTLNSLFVHQKYITTTIKLKIYQEMNEKKHSFSYKIDFCVFVI